MTANYKIVGSSGTSGGAICVAGPGPRSSMGHRSAELDRLTARRTAITFFVLGGDPRLAGFLGALAHRCQGRVVAPDLDGGTEVVADHQRTRR